MSMLSLFEALGRVLLRAPKLVLAVVALASVALGLQLRHIEADPSPRALLASADPAQEALEAESRALFGSSDHVAAIVVSADDVLAREALAYTHALTRALEKLEGVERVDALTKLSWPRPARAQSLDDLDPSDEGPSEAAMSAASDLVMARADVFPDGLASFSERTAGRELAPLVDGESVSDADITRAKELFAKAPRVTGKLISKNRKHLLVAVQLSDALKKHADLEAAVVRIEGALAALPPKPGLRAELTGLPVVRSSLVRHMRADQRILIPGTLVASFIVLLLSFRWAPAVGLPLLSVAITALWLLSGMALFREPLNVLNNMLPALVIIIGLNEAVHIIGRYVEELERLRDKSKALLETFRTMGVACLTTTATSAVGMAALAVSRTEMLRRFGIVGATGLMLAYAVTLLVVPAALALLPVPKEKPAHEEDKRGLIEVLMVRSTIASLQHPYTVLGVAAAFTALCGWASGKIVVDSSLLDQFSKRDPIYAPTQLLETDFDGVRPFEVNLASDTEKRFYAPDLLRAVHAVASWAKSQPGVLSVTDPADPLSLGWAALSGRPEDLADALQKPEQTEAVAALLRSRDPILVAPLLTEDGRHARLRVKLADVGSRATARFGNALEQELQKALAPFADVRFVFGGDAFVSSKGLTAVVSDLSGSVLAAAVVIFLILTLLLHDIKLAVLSIPGNLAPQVWTMAWMVARGIPLNASTAIIFSLSIGLAVDGSIHLVSRYQEERSHKGLLATSAIVRAVRGTGRNIIVSGLALVLGFSVMLLSNFVPVQRFAELITVSMLGCVVATLIVQPVLLRVFNPRRG
jgi:predicted RND superfamily exporter protein